MTADRAAVRAALLDPQSVTARHELCATLAEALACAGEQLWIAGYLIGNDRASGVSPFGYGDDATVAAAYVARTAASLTAGTARLLDDGNAYSASALLRQMVEVDYLMWHFVDEPAAGATWLRASAADRRRDWQPKHLRATSSEPFRDSDYWQHCDYGGHPTHEGGARLLDPEDYLLAGTWLELTVHSLHAWNGVTAVMPRHGFDGSLGVTHADLQERLADALATWRSVERTQQVYQEARQLES